MTGNEIRQTFLEFFAARGHRLVRSSSLVPAADPTLLFTNAGMNQFKDVFLGLERRDYARAATAQKCLRVSGKHNDLENVGRTRRHHTFFEMLGNFSFGDYFKQNAILYAWELMTEVWKLPTEKLIATVFREDDDAYRIWEKEIGIPSGRLFRLGEEDNYWAMGDTGPCGPCSEIQMDFGPAGSELGHKDCAFPCDCGRYVELWNLVFMQFNREASPAGGGASGAMTPLPKPSVDTGAGLERLATTLQGKVSNYDTDLFQPLIEHASELADKDYGEDPRTDVALRVIADHSRAAAFVVGDGVLPSNEGRGYVLRKIIRRAIDYGRQLGLEKPFLFEMAGRVAELMQEPYPELLEHLQRIATVIRAEEEKYARLVEPAVRHVLKHISDTYGPFKLPTTRQLSSTPQPLVLRGEILFYAYDTHGLRPDFVRDLAQSHGWEIDPNAELVFEMNLQAQRDRARASWKGVQKSVVSPELQRIAEENPNQFVGYISLRWKNSRVLAFEHQGDVIARQDVWPGQNVGVILEKTPFYAEGGGQIGDRGWLYREGDCVAEVVDAYSPVAGLIVHRSLVKQQIRLNDFLNPVVDQEARAATMRNHTGTHLLHAALRQVLGPHVKQAGSLVAPDRLRFDFAHYAALDPEELKEIERLANQQILRDAPVTEERMDLEAALKSGALAFFGDKYPEKNVRVITVADASEPGGFYSKELCGGTHVAHTGQIGVVKVLSESSVAAGVRRVEAVTGEQALLQYQRAQEVLKQVAEALHVAEEEVPSAVERLAQTARQLEKHLQAAKHRTAQQQVDELAERVRRVKDVGVLSAQVDDVDRATMRALVDTLRQKLGSGVIVLGTTSDGKVALIAAVTKDLTKRLHAGKIAKEVAGRVGGTGGGRADLAEAGGKEPERLREALDAVYTIVEKML